MRALRRSILRRSILSSRSDSLRCLCAVAMAHKLVLDPFVLRSFDEPTGCLYQFDKSLFEKTVNAAFEDGSAPLVDGYAPFCKHVFVPNFTPAKVSALAISKENEALLRSAYEARTEQELPVLARWFPKEAVGEPPVAKFLDVILYSREQIRKEATAMGRPEELEEDAPWGIISVKPQDVDYELPMQPITMMRNTMVEEGGSGVPLEREKYIASVEFWAGHALIK